MICPSMKSRFLIVGVLLCAMLSSCKMLPFKEVAYVEGPDTPPAEVIEDGIAITLRDQKLTYFQKGKPVMEYPISSSKFGISAKNGSHCTPLGVHAVSDKVGAGQPQGMVFKGGRPTGEIVGVDSKDRDPIVTRVVKLAGLEKRNRNSLRRGIFLHGTPEERYIGTPASYGCIRMRSADIVKLYPYLHRGTPVVIETCSQATYKDCVQRTFHPAPLAPSAPVGSSAADSKSEVAAH